MTQTCYISPQTLARVVEYVRTNPDSKPIAIATALMISERTVTRALRAAGIVRRTVLIVPDVRH